jgi:hypothetical protein
VLPRLLLSTMLATVVLKGQVFRYLSVSDNGDLYFETVLNLRGAKPSKAGTVFRYSLRDGQLTSPVNLIERLNAGRQRVYEAEMARRLEATTAAQEAARRLGAPSN